MNFMQSRLLAIPVGTLLVYSAWFRGDWWPLLIGATGGAIYVWGERLVLAWRRR